MSRQECLPDIIPGMMDADIEQGLLSWFDRVCFESHVCLLWRATSLACIARYTGANDVVPGSLSSQSSWYDMIHAHLTHGQAASTILALLVIPGKQVATAESQGLAGKLLEISQSDDTRDLDCMGDRLYPLDTLVANFFTEDAQLLPGREIVVGELAIVLVDHLRSSSTEQQERPADGYHVNRHEKTV